MIQNLTDIIPILAQDARPLAVSCRRARRCAGTAPTIGFRRPGALLCPAVKDAKPPNSAALDPARHVFTTPRPLLVAPPRGEIPIERRIA
jgi:hypothetical protein